MIEIKNVTKMYGHKKVIDDVSLNIEKGKITSFIGHIMEQEKVLCFL